MVLKSIVLENKIIRAWRSNFLFLLTFLTVAFLPALAWAIYIPKYGVFEQTLTATGNYANPYLEMPGNNDSPGFVVSTFNGPGGETITIDGFWDGGTTWKVRMAPTSVGTWTYSTSSPDSGLNGVTGSFTCVSSSSKGFIRVDPGHPHHFIWDDGTPFFWLGINSGDFHEMHWIVDDDAVNSFQRGYYQQLTDARVAQNFNTFNLFNSLIESKPAGKLKNEGGHGFPNGDFNNLNPSFYQWVDKRVAYSTEKGFVMAPALGWPDSGLLNISTDKLIRAWRYMIARYAAYNIVWVFLGEYEEAGSGASIVNTLGNITKKWDPYKHLRTTHTLNTTSELDNESWLDFHMTQAPPSSTNFFGNKPTVATEIGVEPGNGINTPDGTRKGAWEVVMRGGYYGHLYAPGGSTINLINNLQNESSLYLKHMADFFKAIQFNLLEPNQSLVNNGFCKANTGLEYVVYLPSGGNVSVDLSGASGSLNVKWYNTRTGMTIAESTTTGGGSRSFIAPDNNDWALHIGGTGGNQLPTASYTASPLSGEKPLAVNFDASASTDSDGTIESYSWDFGDGSTTTGLTTSHTYTTIGSFIATLTVTDDQGSSNSTQKTINVSGPLTLTTITITPSDISLQPGSTATLTVSGKDQNGNSFPVNVNWSATGGTINAAGQFFAGTQEGNFTVTVTDGAVSGAGNVTVDATPPTLVSVKAIDANKVEVTFSEPLDIGSAALVSNYAITGSDNSTISVIDTTNSAENASNGKALLLTGPHVDGVTYTLLVSGVTDMAGNVIAPNSTVNYTFVAQSQLIISNLAVVSGKSYEVVQDGLTNGAIVYIDRGYTYTAVPSTLQGSTYIKTANGDKGSSGVSFLTFDVNQNVTIYVAHDNRASNKPSWLASFTDTGDDIVTSDTTFSVFKKDFPSGTVVLGGNEADSMYIVIITGQGTGSTPDTTPPAKPTGLTVE